MLSKKFKSILLVVGLLMPIAWCGASVFNSFDGFSHILIKAGDVHSDPKGSSIQATINGHTLSIIFLENLGQVSIEVSNLNGAVVETTNTPTPHGVDMYISNTGSYIVTFTLSNGDEYYGEFEVTE